APAARPRAARRTRRGAGHRLRLQGAGEHGSAPSRSNRVRAPVLRAFPSRRKALSSALGSDAERAQSRAVPRAGSRARRRGVRRGHHRNPEPRQARDRRHALRGRAAALRRDSELRARALAARPPDGSDAREAPLSSARAARRGRRGPHLQAESGGYTIVGVVGPLQFDVLADRIQTEYEIPVVFEGAGLFTARWVHADDPRELERFVRGNEGYLAEDHT